MNRKFAGKIALIAGLMLILMIPLTMIEGVIGERAAYRSEARTSIAESWTGAQKLLGPVVVVPYVEHLERKQWDEKTGKSYMESYTEEKRLFLLPERLIVNGTVATEERSRGIYSIPVYGAKLQVEGSFNNQALIERAKSAKGQVEWLPPFLAVMVSDIRGVVTQPQLNWKGAAHEFLAGSGVAEQGAGMHVVLSGLSTEQADHYPFDFAVELHGMERLEFSPVGKETAVTLDSDWPHPSFIGRYLPAERDITPQAFKAKWLVSSFSSDMAQSVARLAQGDGGEFVANTFGVSLMNSVDVYQQTERSVKYGLLFLSLTFTIFFLYEVMKGLRLHPMQYLLVGMALTVFYLLLISLSEHIAFGAAYPIAALACVGVIGVYISEVLRSRKRALVFSGMLVLLYGMLYAILRSEDNALLMGSLLLFGVLTLVMMVTRRLDWYGVADQMAQQAVVAREPGERR